MYKNGQKAFSFKGSPMIPNQGICQLQPQRASPPSTCIGWRRSLAMHGHTPFGKFGSVPSVIYTSLPGKYLRHHSEIVEQES